MHVFHHSITYSRPEPLNTAMKPHSTSNAYIFPPTFDLTISIPLLIVVLTRIQNQFQFQAVYQMNTEEPG